MSKGSPVARAHYDFAGRVLVLSGASGGIGRATARRFFDCGAGLALTYHRNEAVHALARKLDPRGERILTSRVDVRRPRDCEDFAAQCRERFGCADFLVNNAAVLRMASVRAMSSETWREVMAANLDSVFYMCRAFLPILRNGGAIVNVASTAAHRGAADHSAYAASKAAVLAFSRSLARELAPRIRCNGISPGMVDTGMLGEMPEELVQAMRDESPYRRLGDPEEIAAAIAFLCSEDASFVTAETLHVNGACYVPS